MTIESITRQMHVLEIVIAREQKYIARWGEHNDVHSDAAWEQYKAQAEYNLRKWDFLKSQRDALRRSTE